uniref:Disease resistance R13L4/SHOC-2-like LRR domain-containing protein n=1 Tax=Trieres chinensis TaxID=1514140 RepID=A0A7S2ERU3_TRICV
MPSELGWMRDLVELNLSKNSLVGTLPDDFFSLPRLESLILSWNGFTGDIPSDMNYEDDPFEDDDEYDPPDYIWTGVPRLECLALDHNHFEGTIRPDMLLGVSPTIKVLDLSDNELTGTLPAQIGLLKKLGKLNLSYNDLDGPLPTEIGELSSIVKINMTANAFTGTPPEKLCGMFTGIFGCDGLLCPPGTFHPDGAANERGACRPCPDKDDDDDEYIPLSAVLGRTNCDAVEFVDGDMNGDGHLDEREILRLIYAATNGENWGDAFMDWPDIKVDKCNLAGVNCKDTLVTKIDLREATLCANAAGNQAGSPERCPGLPGELGLLAHLEVLDLSRSTFLLGTIPTELGLLKTLRVLDLSSCTSMEGSIPSEIGQVTSLRVLNLAESSFTGTLPDTIGNLRMLEKINIGLNKLHGTLPSTLGGLESIREILLSRAHLGGTLPSELGNLRSLENLELYGNDFIGTIPDMSNASALKRIDCFNNKLTGQFPSSLASISQIQIVHLKNNRLTGTLPENLGNLPLLSWLDVSNNNLVGTIPPSLGTITSLRDIRMGGNKIHGPVPESLCSNTRVNAGRTRQFGCDAVICPLGTFSGIGYATDSDGGECKECLEGETTQYLGSRLCRTFTQRDFLSMFFDAMSGEEWSDDQKKGWKDENLSECEWAGVSCDEEGKVDGLEFPISGSSWDPNTY